MCVHRSYIYKCCIYVLVLLFELILFLPESVELPTLPLFSTSSNTLISLHALNYICCVILCFVSIGSVILFPFISHYKIRLIAYISQHNKKIIFAHPFIWSYICFIFDSVIIIQSIQWFYRILKIQMLSLKMGWVWLIRVKWNCKAIQWNSESFWHIGIVIATSLFDLPAKLFMALPLIFQLNAFWSVWWSTPL